MGQFVCSQGHSWSLKDGTPGVCPECGNDGTLLAAPTFGPAGLQHHVERDAERADGVSGWPAIPGHDILGVLGHGGMGVVYEARQVELGRIVAIKMIQSASGAGPDLRRRFRTEAEAVARLHHPNIVQIYEIGECAGQPYFSLEYVAGGSLARRIAVSLPPAGQAAMLLETLARAIHYAHQRGVVHRDLKPANILLCGDGPAFPAAGGDVDVQGDTITHAPEALGTPKITDFGLAKQLDDDSGHTRSGAVMGTPSYMAPEQAAGQICTIDARTDVYALGAILYELLTGRPPFRAASVLETLEQVRSREPAPPRQLQPGLPRDLETICLTCLQKEPGRRYASALALAEDLRRLRTGEPIQARPVSTPERLWRWCRRKPALASLTAALVAMTAVALVVVTSLWIQADRESRRVATLNAGLTLERGQTYCEQGDTVRGMLWMAHALELAPAEAGDLQRVIRANLAGWSRQLHPLEAIFPHRGAVGPAWKGRIIAVAFSPDGSKVAVGGADGRVQMWNAATGEPYGPALEHEKEVLAVAFSPDGRVLATGSARGAGWWDVASGRRIGPAVAHRNRVDRLAFSPDGRRLLTGSSHRSAEAFRLWDVANGKPLGPSPAKDWFVCSVAFSPDGRLALVSGEERVRLFLAASGQPIEHTLEHPGNIVHGAVFRPDGRTIVTNATKFGKSAGSIIHWSTGTGERIAGPFATEHAGYLCVFRKDGAALAAHMPDNFGAQLLDVATGKAIGGAMKHEGMVTAAAFTSDGQRIVTTSGDFTGRVWNATTGLPLGSALQHHEGVWSVAVSPDSQTALTGSYDGTAKLWRLSPPASRVLAHDSEVYSILFSPDGETLLTASRSDRDSVRSWNPKTGQARPLTFSMPKGCRALALSRDGQVLAAGSDVQHRRWDLRNGSRIEPDVKITGRSVFAQTFSPDGVWLVVGYIDGTVQVWDNVANRPLYPPLVHGGEVRAVDFSPNGRLLLTAADDRTVRFWNPATGEEVGDKRVYNGAILAAAFSPDGKSYVTGGNDRIARQWSTDTGAPVGPSLSHEDIVLAVAFSPDGQLILTGSARSARLWDATTGKMVGPPILHKSHVWSVAISPDGKTLASGSGDHTVQLVDTPQPVGGTVADVVRWVQVATGHELNADGGVQVLEAAAWRERRERLNAAEVLDDSGSVR